MSNLESSQKFVTGFDYIFNKEEAHYVIFKDGSSSLFLKNFERY
ncbi:hypothetical protein T11_11163 [Trichinella zimbabwensis]|uniref:Uncharacterized protein n=1 Tax=Trichinella zimbabwensis TaxID=268475 RepID=A0A0V1GLJ5_9BILA|nr:hypothetical protein T11_11163 [Trichinella zimbabwensis]